MVMMGGSCRPGEHVLRIPKLAVRIGEWPNLEHRLMLAARHRFVSAYFVVTRLADGVEACSSHGTRFALATLGCVEGPPSRIDDLPLATTGSLGHAGELLQFNVL